MKCREEEITETEVELPPFRSAGADVQGGSFHTAVEQVQTRCRTLCFPNVRSRECVQPCAATHRCPLWRTQKTCCEQWHCTTPPPILYWLYSGWSAGCCAYSPVYTSICSPGRFFTLSPAHHATIPLFITCCASTETTLPTRYVEKGKEARKRQSAKFLEASTIIWVNSHKSQVQQACLLVTCSWNFTMRPFRWFPEWNGIAQQVILFSHV